MKKPLLFAVLCIATLSSFATIRTVSNQTPNPGQYATIQAAINASSAGDTVYVHGSQFSYSGFSLDRQLTLIGSGFEPTTSNINPYTIISVANTLINNVNASGSLITGFKFIGFSILFSSLAIHDITISRCWFQNDCNVVFNSNNYRGTLTENMFYDGRVRFSGTTNAYDFLISNNVFRQFISNPSIESFTNVANTQVTNNLFYGNGIHSIAFNTYGVAFSNNIFNKVSFTGLTSSTFSNNLTNLCTGNPPWISNGTDLGAPALGTQNIAETSPNFIYQTDIDAGSIWGSTNFSTFYGVNPGSPTLSSMPGDPDMGPYGGSGSYNFNRADASTLPYVYSISIGNPTIQAGSNLNIDVIGKKHD